MEKETEKSIINVLDSLGMSQEEREKILVQIVDLISERIFLEAMEKLDDRGREEYVKIVEEGADLEKQEKFLKSKIADYDDLAQKELGNFKEETNRELTYNRNVLEKD